tara:strand:+ start:1666 stop:1815 length:150 start_codon:yes stop_codon:yes gene_type:complete
LFFKTRARRGLEIFFFYYQKVKILGSLRTVQMQYLIAQILIKMAKMHKF